MHLLEKEAAPVTERDTTTARVLLVPTINGIEYEATQPQLTMACKLRLTIQDSMLYIVAASVIISFISRYSSYDHDPRGSEVASVGPHWNQSDS